MRALMGIMIAVLAGAISAAPAWAQGPQLPTDLPNGPSLGGQEQGRPVLQQVKGSGNQASQGNQPEMEAERASRLMGLLIQNKEFADKLGLTEDQKKQIQSSTKEYQRTSMDLRHKLESAGLSQVEALSETSIDEKKLMSAVEEAGKMRTEIAKLRMKQLLAFQKILTPEQIAKIKEHRMQMRSNLKDGQTGPGSLWQQRLQRSQRAGQSTMPPAPGQPPLPGGEDQAKQAPGHNHPEGPGPDGEADD